MPAVNGIKGSISVAGAATDLNTSGPHAILANKWSGSLDRDTHEVTPYSPDGNAKQHVGGLHSMSGSMSGFLDDTAPHVHADFTTDEAPVAFLLTATTNRTYSFNGILSNWSVDSDVQGVCTWSATFISDGAIAIG